MVHAAADPATASEPFPRPETLTAAVSRHIGEAVIRGEYPPGTALPEVALAARFGVARGTVREALRQLQGEGFVEVFPHRGAFVASTSTNRVQELLTLRMLTEAYAARRLAERRPIPDPSGAEIAGALESFRQTVRRGGASSDFVDADLHFHESVSRAGADETLLNLLCGTGKQARRLLILGNVYDGSDPDREIAAHEELFATLQTGTPDEVEAAFRSHIGGALEILLSRFREREP